MPQILNTGNLTSHMGVKCLGYGRAGVGKTRLARTAPRVLIFSAESGLLSLKKERVNYIKVTSMAELGEAHEWAMKSREAKNFDTYCLDSISDIGESLLFEESRKQKDPRKLYPEYQAKMLDMMRDFRDMPQKHIYFIAKETNMQVVGGVLKAAPMFPGKVIGEQAPYFFDQVFRTTGLTNPQTQQGEVWLQCQLTPEADAKDRSGALAMWEPPDLSQMFMKIMNS